MFRDQGTLKQRRSSSATCSGPAPCGAYVLLCALPELLRAVGDWRLVMYGLAVIIIMIVRPKGLMGGKELPVGRICRAVGRIFTKKKKDLPPPDGGSVGEEASV